MNHLTYTYAGSTIHISVYEASSFQEDGYTVSGSGRLVYKAQSEYGKTYASTPEGAVALAREQAETAILEA